MEFTVAKFDLPNLTDIVKHDDYAMAWYDHGDSFSPCCHHGMIITMFLHDHGLITGRSWHGSHVFPTQVCTNSGISVYSEFSL